MRDGKREKGTGERWRERERDRMKEGERKIEKAEVNSKMGY